MPHLTVRSCMAPDFLLMRIEDSHEQRLGWNLVGSIELADQYSRLRGPPETPWFFRIPVLILLE